jgi:hypothetical protein
MGLQHIFGGLQHRPGGLENLLSKLGSGRCGWDVCCLRVDGGSCKTYWDLGWSAGLLGMGPSGGS